jgi:hypothetical protein
MIVCSGRSGRRREAQGSGDAGMAGQGQAGQTSQGLFAPGREPNSRSGAVTTVTLAIQVAAQSGGSGSPRLLRSLIPGTSIRFVRVRSYDRPDRSIATVLPGTSM